MKNNKELDFSESIRAQADEKAGYPPKCNEGYVEKDGKCVPVSDSGYKKKKK